MDVVGNLSETKSLGLALFSKLELQYY